MIVHQPKPAADICDEPGCTPSERRQARRYRTELLSTIAVYAVFLVISTAFVDRASGAAKVAIALLPLPAFTAVVLASVRFYRNADELTRQVLAVSAATASLAVCVLTMGIGFLENAGIPRPSFTWIWPMFCAAFGVALPIVRRHYR